MFLFLVGALEIKHFIYLYHKLIIAVAIDFSLN